MSRMGDARDCKIFISYSRKDDVKLVGEKFGWVTRFAKNLQALMPAAFGDNVTVWSDTRLDGNLYFADAIDEATAISSLLVPIVSWSYINDEHGWLNRERTSFILGAQKRGGLRLGNKSRICPVINQRVDREKLPDVIQALNLKYEFFDEDGSPLNESDYEKRLHELANTLGEMLRNLQKEPVLHVRPSTPTQVRVYLADATPDVERERQRVEKELVRLGYQVVCSQPLPTSDDQACQTIQTDLGQCCLSVHLLGGNLDGADPVVQRQIRLQQQVARKMGAPALTQIVWTPGWTTLDQMIANASTKEQSDGYSNRRFYEELRKPSGYTYRHGDFEGLVKAIGEILVNKLRDPGRQEIPDGVMRMAYIVCDEADRELMKSYQQSFWARDWWAEFWPETDEEQDFEQLHLSNLHACQAFVIYYGKTKERFVKVLCNDYREAQFIRPRRAPLYSKWIYRGADPDPQKFKLARQEDYIFRGNFEKGFTDDFITQVTEYRPQN